jgi:hypothetical protein
MTGNLQAILGQIFVASDVPQSEYKLLPEDDYLVEIVGSEIKPTAKGGTQLVFDFTVVGSNYDGCVLKERLNIVNDNQTAVEIAFQTLAKIVTACGMESINDSSELHGKRLIAKVAIKKGTGTYTANDGTQKPSADQNQIKSFFATGTQTTSTTQPQAQPVTAAPETGKKMPWAK